MGEVDKIRNFGGAHEGYKIWLTSQLNCKGSEENIGSCLGTNQRWGDTNNCTHLNDVGVNCTGTCINLGQQYCYWTILSYILITNAYSFI